MVDTAARVEFDRTTGSTVEVRLAQLIAHDIDLHRVADIVGFGMEPAFHRP